MKRKFWNWVRDADTGARTLVLNGEISESTWFGDEVTPGIFRDELCSCEGDITVWINSPGGDCFAAAQIYNMLMDYKGNVKVRIDGLAASAASVIAMAGNTVEMSPVAMLMIHNPATVSIGDEREMKKAIDNGIVPQYYVENSHEAIIPRDLYMQVQEEMVRRANLHSGANHKKRVYSSRYALSSLVYCPKCGDIYRRIAWNNRGKRSIVWRCANRVENGPKCCDAPTVQESELQEAVIKAINMALGGKDDMLVALEQNIASVLALEDEGSMESISAKLEELQKELLKRANAKKDYNDLADEIDRLREAKQNAMAENAEREGLKQRIAEMQEFLAQQMEQIEEYDESLVRRMVEKVTVYESKFSVEFKSGTSVDVER